jgi:parallel beta-helix repeat protein
LDNFTVSNSRKGIVWDTQISWPPPDNITIYNSIIENNGKQGDTSIGGGILVCGENNRIMDNVIRNNHGGRGAGLSRSGTPVNLLLEGNRIENNICYDDHGGGVYLDGSVTLNNNLIDGNRVALEYGWGGGLLILGTARMSRNTISNNYAPSYGGGVFIDEGATAWMNNDIVYNNFTGQGIGAGIALDDGYEGASHLFMTNCTVAFNNPDFPVDEYSRGGNGLFLDNNSSATVTNSVFWGNVDDFSVRDGSALTLTYSLNQEGWSGTGNFSSDPLFADAAAGNFHLRSITGRYDPATDTYISDDVHSPGIDAGDPVSSFSNEPPPNGSRINVGCYGNTYLASQSKESGSIVTLTRTQVSQLYVSIFNRASEGEGNIYWQSQPDMAAAATAMLDTDAARDYFGSSLDTHQAFIEHIYLNTLNKTTNDDLNGIQYWVKLLDEGTSRGGVVAALVGVINDYAPVGASYNPDDVATVAAYKQFTNRVEVSDYMADRVMNTPDDWQTVTSFSANLTVTDDNATVSSAKMMVDSL